MGSETIFVVQQTGFGIIGASVSQEGVDRIPLPEPRRPFIVDTTQLHRPDLRPIYGGPTLLEALWTEMGRLMEGLMTGQEAEDGGDRFRAAELAWVLAIVTDPYSPSVDKIRAETVARWNASQEEK
jgi:hypothetical protein